MNTSPSGKKVLGARLLREWRIARGMTQYQVGRLLDISDSFMSRYENGACVPGLARAFDFQRITEGAVPAEAWSVPDERQAG